MKTAKLIRENIEGYNGVTALFELSESIEYDIYVTNKIKYTFLTMYVICCTINLDDPPILTYRGYNTFIFPATKKGKIINHSPIKGSLKGEKKHSEALLNAGYNMVYTNFATSKINLK